MLKELKEQRNIFLCHMVEMTGLSRDTIKRNAATIKAKEQSHEAPKQLKSQGQEL